MVHTFKNILIQYLLTMDGTYQIRRFKQIKNAPIKFINSDAFTDIYLHRKGHTQIGIKFRQPKQKQYGWKLKGFQCKISRVQKHHLGYQLEKWKKYKLNLEEPIKLKIKNISKLDQKQKMKKQQESQDSYQQISIQKFGKKVNKIYLEICKAFLKSELKNNEIVSNWCNNFDQQKYNMEDNLDVFVFIKQKNKIGGKQFGTLKVQRLFHNPQSFYFQTECIQSSNPNNLKYTLKQWNNQNVSYPKLLEKLFYKVKSQKKNQKQINQQLN